MRARSLSSLVTPGMFAAVALFVLILGCCLRQGIAAPDNPYKAPLYWSPYEYNLKTDGYIPEAEWSANIDWVEKSLKPYGYTMVCIDGWGDDDQWNRYGYRMSHSSHWTHDYAWWAANLKSRGMSLGIYNNPLWINKRAAESGVLIKGTKIPLKSIMNEGENAKFFQWVQVDRPGAEQYVKGYVQFYADMGVRYLRVDFLSWFETGYDHNVGKVGPKRPRADYETALRWMREACDANGMFLSLVMPNLNDEAELESRYGHMFRVNEDAGDGGWGRFSDLRRGQRIEGWSQYGNAFDGITYWSKVAGKGKVILDPDFLRLNTFASDDERKSAISACILAGGPVSVADRYNTIESNLWIYQNAELLELNAERFAARPLTNDPSQPRSQIWTGALENGDRIVGLFNRENVAEARSIAFADLGIASSAYVRDLWQHNDLGRMASYSASIPPHGCVILRVSTRKPARVNGPFFGTQPGIYTLPQSIQLAANPPDARIYFTLDGATPTGKSPLYTHAIPVDRTTTIRAFARKDRLPDSPVVSGTFTINLPAPLPRPWQASPAGNPVPTGAASNAGDRFTITAAGDDIEGTADSFHGVFQRVAGDVTVTARVDSLTDTSEWAKAGLMIRRSLDAGAENVFLGITPANGVISQYREKPGGGTTSKATFGQAAPIWLRIRRTGDKIARFQSLDGRTWTQDGDAVELPLGTSVYIGMALTSHRRGTLANAVFSHVSVSHAAD